MSVEDQSRRRFLRNSGLLLGTAASGYAGGVLGARTLPEFGAAANAFNLENDRHALSLSDGIASNRLTRIAFGSCANQDKAQPIWDAILAAQPDLFLFLGDCVYGDSRDITHLRDQYTKLARKTELQRLRANVPVMAMWDDHDFGENDGGIGYPIKDQSRQTFLDFWDEPKQSPRWSRSGLYTARVFGPPGQRVQIIMPDLRYNRTQLTVLDLGKRYEEWEATKRSAGVAVPGPYARCADRTATMLGDEQWRWFEQQLEVPAQFRIIASSLQVLADFPGWEAWVNYACDHQRLIDAIRRKNANGVVFVSGDTHYAELSKLDMNVPYPLWDLTSSGLTEVWDDEVPNSNRVGHMMREQNFGMLTIDWTRRDPELCLQACDGLGVAKLSQTISLSQLQATHRAQYPT